MQNAASLIERKSSSHEHSKHPIVWSAGYIEKLKAISEGREAGYSSVDKDVSRIILQCVSGCFKEAEEEFLAQISTKIGELSHDKEVFISFMFACFVIQRFDILSAMFKDRFSVKINLIFEMITETVGAGCVKWDILSDGRDHRFTFSAAALNRDDTRTHILQFMWAFPLFSHFIEKKSRKSGTVFINQHDIGYRPGLAYCDSRPDYFLIPDYIFIPSEGYSYARQIFSERSVKWNEKILVAFWRGATTGVPTVAGDWRTIERFRLCEIAQKYADTNLFDVGFSSVIQVPDPNFREIVKEKGFLRGRVPWQDWGKYRYLIDIDGNSSPWSNLFQKLLTGSVVFKVESRRGLRQWFYDDLIPWKHFVPVAPDMSDLFDKLCWIGKNDAFAQLIGRNAMELAARLSYDHEISRGAATIDAAFRYFGGDLSNVAPYGRSVASSEQSKVEGQHV
jgi:hypothetical protein